MKKILWISIISLTFSLVSIPFAVAADTKAPSLTSWKLIETKADISSGPAKVSVEFSVTDETSIQTPSVTFGSKTTTQSLGFAAVEKITGNEKSATYRATATIPINSAPGQWSWTLFPLKDSLGNGGGFGPGDVYANIVEVTGPTADTLKDVEAKAKAAAELIAKLEAEARAAAELKAKQEAEARAANTAAIPPGNVSCSLSSSGVNFGVSISFTSGNFVIGNLTYDWDYAVLITGRDPNLVANYSSRQYFKSTSANALAMSYEELLSLASNNPSATVLVFASPKNVLGDGSVKNTSGRGCFVELKSVLSNKTESEKVAAAELKAKQEAEAKATAELKAKQEAEAKATAELKAKLEADAKVIAQKVLAELLRRDQAISVFPLLKGNTEFSASGIPISVTTSSNLAIFSYNSTNSICEYRKNLIITKKSGRCVIAFRQEGNEDFKPAENVVLEFNIVTASKTTITCVKGKLTKKVTAIKPVCPVGYKKK